MVDYIVAHIPEIAGELDRVGEELDDNSYYAVARLYEFAVEQFRADSFVVVSKLFALVELALSSGEQQLEDPFWIEIFENLENDMQTDHYKFFVGILGPVSLAALRKDIASRGLPNAP